MDRVLNLTELTREEIKQFDVAPLSRGSYEEVSFILRKAPRPVAVRLSIADAARLSHDLFHALHGDTPFPLTIEFEEVGWKRKLDRAMAVILAPFFAKLA